MKKFKVYTQVRWSDLDANMHLANQSYMSFTSFARMKALNEIGFSTRHMQKWQRGPVIFEEKFNFFREILPDTTIYIHTRITGTSTDRVLFEFQHDLYDEKGEHKANSRIFGCWLDYTTRKMATSLPPEMSEKLGQFHTPEVRILSITDLKNLSPKAENISVQELI
ncbi:MAG: thioesterase family protein [Flavobacteriaceae bacterium]|nr:thioesterase family protein [Flavobacteriaceae bacterium]